jgi:hypothetical protein
MTYMAEVSIVGTAALLQHKYELPSVAEMSDTKRKSGKEDYRFEWLRTMYANRDGLLYQPAIHIEGALTKSAKSFKIEGGRGKTYGDLVKAYVYCRPDEILYVDPDTGDYLQAPDESLLENPTEVMQVNMMRVRVQSAAVARLRLMLNPGWNLRFSMEVIDEQLPPASLVKILDWAGRTVGIGDFRPRYGRFDVVGFVVDGKSYLNGK